MRHHATDTGTGRLTMNPEAIAALQQWLDNPEPGTVAQEGTENPTVRERLQATAGTLSQQAVVRLLQAIAPEPNQSQT